MGNDLTDLQALTMKGNAFSSTKIFYTIHGGGVTTSSPGSEHGVVRVKQYDDRDHDARIAHSARRTTDQ